jgi:hypothetical protein
MPGLLLLVLLLVVGAFVSARWNEAFYVTIRATKLVVVRGHLPPPILDAFADVIREARVRRGNIRGMRDGDRVRLVTRGIAPAHAQRLRNILGCQASARPLRSR